MQRRPLDKGGQPPTVAPALVQDLLHHQRTAGQPLPTTTRRAMQARLGHDFSQVRIHTNAQAAASAQAVQARAYTAGSDVVFGAGQYRPATLAGQRLLAHELAHVVQQRGALAASAGELTIGDPASAAEREAEQVSAQVIAGQPAAPGMSTAGATVQRDNGNESEDQFQLHWPGPRQPSFQLHLDPEIEAQMAAIRIMQQALALETVRSSLFQVDIGTLLATQPPPWLTLPGGPGASPSQPAAPLVPRGAGPAEPRPATGGDVLRAILAVPAVNSALTNLRTQATTQLRSGWDSLATGERALVITQGALLGAGVLGGVLSSPEGRDFTLGLIQNRALPVPGVPGLTFQFNLTGPDQRVQFGLNVGALLPPSFGFRRE
ncbi:MAG: DUF4157 domain-containing protein [Caldilineaceae bacterium]